MFERLTERSDAFDCIAIINPRDPEGLYELGDLDTDEDADLINAVADRLAAYEDSGLSPEEVQKLKKSDASKEQCTIDQHGEIHRLRDELKRYKQAEQDGRLVVLPCKVGTRVWVIGQDCDLCHDMYTEEPCLFGDCEYRKVIESVFLPGMTDEFGKTVFLTREEAEKALGGVSDGN